MTIAFIELFEGRSVNMTKDGLTAVRTFMYESGDPVAILDELPAYGTYNPEISNIVLLSTSCEPLPAKDRCKVTLNYGPPEKMGGGGGANQYGETWTWQMLAQSKTVTVAPSVGATPVREWTMIPTVKNDIAAANNFIGYDGKEYKGASLYQPTGVVNVNKVFRNGTEINAAVRKDFYKAQAKTNSKPWLDWGVGEMLCIGVSIRYSPPPGKGSIAQCSVDYSFIFGLTTALTAFEILDSSTGSELMMKMQIPNIRPHEYVWQEPYEKVVYPQGPSGPAKKSRGPNNVKIAKMYDEIDFSILKLVGP